MHSKKFHQLQLLIINLESFYFSLFLSVHGISTAVAMLNSFPCILCHHQHCCVFGNYSFSVLSLFVWQKRHHGLQKLFFSVDPIFCTNLPKWHYCQKCWGVFFVFCTLRPLSSGYNFQWVWTFHVQFLAIVHYRLFLSRMNQGLHCKYDQTCFSSLFLEEPDFKL